LLKVAQGLHLLNWVFWLPIVLLLSWALLDAVGLLIPDPGKLSSPESSTDPVLTLAVLGAFLSLGARAFWLLHTPAWGKLRWIRHVGGALFKGVFWLCVLVVLGRILLALASFSLVRDAKQIFSPGAAREEAALTVTLITFTVVGPFLNLWGRALCLLHSPATGKARRIVTITVIFDAATLLLSFANILIILPQLLRVLGLFQAIWVAFLNRTAGSVALGIVQLANTTLFLFYLRCLAEYVERPKLARRTMVIFVLGVLGILGAGALLALLRQGFFRTYEIGSLSVAAVTLLVWALYGDLHYHIRRAILKKLQPQPPAPVQETAPGPPTAPVKKDVPTREAATTQAVAPTQAAAPTAKRKDKRERKKKKRR
jgi:hypothetical protein